MNQCPKRCSLEHSHPANQAAVDFRFVTNRSTFRKLRDPLARQRIFTFAITRSLTFSQEKPMKYALLTCGLLMATSAIADAEAPGGAHRLQALDIDGDQLISLAEAQAGAPRLAARFSSVDANQDGMLSPDELAAGQPLRKVRFDIEKDFAAADADSDGMLTRAEAAEMPIVNDFFGEMDGNSDGYFTQDEIRAHAREHGPIRVIKRIGPGVSRE